MLKDKTRETTDRAVDVTSLIAGALLFFSPWLLGFAGEASAACNAWIAGALVALVAVGALVNFQQWQEWANLVLGVWTFFAPWILSFAALGTALSVHLVVGVIVALCAAYELWKSNNRPLSTA